MSPYWLNDTCSPYTAPDAACNQGNLAVYAINVSSAADVAAGLAFARAHNIRLTVKNTGHDYIGRSSGAGSLALWMHNLKDISFVANYTSAAYSGPAARVAAGVQFFELYAAAAARGLRVAGGFCPTVGIAGGYVQGAGHGPLGGTYGLAADNALEFEVVTADGRHLVASPAQHADLYWALSGGGGGNYGVVLALTTRAHPDGRVAGGSFAFANEDEDAYYAAIAAWQEHLLVLDQIPGWTTVWGFTNASFNVAFVTLAGGDAGAVADGLAPYFAKLEALGVRALNVETSDRSNFYEHIEHYTGNLPYGPYVTNDIIAGRLIPRTTVQHNASALTAELRALVSGQAHGFPASTRLRVNGIAANVSHARAGNAAGANAVLPAWRDALYWLNVDVTLDPATPAPALALQQARLNAVQARLRDATPGGGAYMNEATFDDAHWRADYYGANYPALLRVKDAYDPDALLYAHTSVGADRVTVAADGRLCRAH